MINDSLKTVLGDDLFNQVKAKVEADPNKDKIRIENVDIESGNYIPKSKFNEVNEALKTANTEIATRDTQLADLKKSAKGNEDLLTKINELQTANTTTKAEADKKIADLQKENAISEALYGAKARNPKAIKGMLDLTKVEFKDGKVVGLDEQLAEIKKSDAYLFEAVKTTPGFNPAADGSGEKTPSQAMNDLIRGAF